MSSLVMVKYMPTMLRNRVGSIIEELVEVGDVTGYGVARGLQPSMRVYWRRVAMYFDCDKSTLEERGEFDGEKIMGLS